KAETNADEWLLIKLQRSTKAVTDLLEKYRFSEAYDEIYHLLWDDFADWYIEASKVSLNKGLLGYALETILKLTHPFAPFITETIWQTFNNQADSLLITTQWPEARKGSVKAYDEFEEIKALVS